MIEFHYPHDPDDEWDEDDFRESYERWEDACEERAEFEREQYPY